MNRLIMTRLPLLALLAALLSAGCAVEQSTQQSDNDESTGTEVVGLESSDEGTSTTKRPQNKKLNADGSEVCAACGPLPDPWVFGPLPDPWQSNPSGTPDPNAPKSGGSGGGDGHKDK